MKVLLIQPPIEDFYTTPIRLYPLGLLYAAATLRKMGHEVELLDCLQPPRKRQLPIPATFKYLEKSFADNPFLFKHFYRFGRDDHSIMAGILEAKPNIIGISSQFTAYFNSVARLARQIKNVYPAPIFIGGHHATVFAEQIKHRAPWIDDVLIGPAETALPAYMSKWDQSAAAVDWTILQPAHDLLQADLYQIGKRPYASTIASRGCPFTCEFCSVHAMFGRKIIYRTIDAVIDEMCGHAQRQVRIVNFEDDNLSFNRQWFMQFLHRVIDEPRLANCELTAMNGLCYPTLDGELLELMYRAGFRRLDLSFVTQESSLRRSLRRPNDSESFAELVQQAKRVGFMITAYIIIGLPQQSYAEIKKSIDFLLELEVLVGPSVFYIPPASGLYEKLNQSAELRDSWEQYRSSAFAVETQHLSRSDLIDLFAYVRRENLKRKQH